MEIFRTNFAEKMIIRKWSGLILLESDWFCTNLQMILTKTDGDLSIFVRKWWLLPYAMTSASVTSLTYKYYLCKTSGFAGKFEQFVWTTCLYLFDTKFFLTEIVICSFNNNALKKYANGKAFYIVVTVSVQFFATLI